MVENTETILTLHPAGKKGRNISKRQYELMRTAILRSLKTFGSLNHTELLNAAGHILPRDYEGAIGWYHEMVKLDLEARGLIGRVPGTRPVQYRVTGSGATEDRKERKMRPNLVKAVKVKRDAILTLEVTVGYAQASSTIVKLGGVKLAPDPDGTWQTPEGAELDGVALSCTTSVTAMNRPPLMTSVSYVLTGGETEVREMLKEAAAAPGEVIRYTARFELYV